MNIKYILPIFRSNWTFLVFLVGKIIRFIFFAGFIYFLLKGANSLAGYSLEQTLFFFLTFNLIDVISQFLFREVYRFRPQIISGSFDLTLLKPLNPLFRVLLGGADAIDLITIPPLLYLVIHVGIRLNPNFIQAALFVILLLNGLLMATAFHIAVLAMGIITLEIDHTIMIYRDLTALGRFPIDIYREPLRGILTYLLPIGVMISLPAKALMGLVSAWGVLSSFGLASLAIFISLRFWNFALKKYTSASS